MRYIHDTEQCKSGADSAKHAPRRKTGAQRQESKIQGGAYRDENAKTADGVTTLHERPVLTVAAKLN